jgi:hypothetical protein
MKDWQSHFTPPMQTQAPQSALAVFTNTTNQPESRRMIR